mgnify:CR=1 FL=1
MSPEEIEQAMHGNRKWSLPTGELINFIECLLDEVERLKQTVIRYDKAESAALADMEKYKDQIEVLRPVYEAAKVWQGAFYFGKHGNMDYASYALEAAIKVAARELEDGERCVEKTAKSSGLKGVSDGKNPNAVQSLCLPMDGRH